MNRLIFWTCFLFSTICYSAGPYKIAILDSGFTPLPMDNSVLKLCKSGHYDYDQDVPDVGYDMAGHGSYVTYLINKNAKTKNICFLIYKVFGYNVADGHKAIDDALVRARNAGAQAINMSLYMSNYSHRTRSIVKYITNKGVKVFVSAGNENRNLNKYCLTYPVCYKGINKNLVVVGALDYYGGVASYSNYGARVDVYDMGDINKARGTSFSAPRVLGKYVRSLRLDK